MSYLLDTNVCIRLLNNSSQSVTTRLAQQQPKDIYLCTVVQMELYYGAYHSNQSERNLALLERFFNQFACDGVDRKLLFQRYENFKLPNTLVLSCRLTYLFFPTIAAQIPSLLLKKHLVYNLADSLLFQWNKHNVELKNL